MAHQIGNKLYSAVNMSYNAYLILKQTQEFIRASQSIIIHYAILELSKHPSQCESLFDCIPRNHRKWSDPPKLHDNHVINVYQHVHTLLRSETKKYNIGIKDYLDITLLWCYCSVVDDYDESIVNTIRNELIQLTDRTNELIQLTDRTNELIQLTDRTNELIQLTDRTDPLIILPKPTI